MSTLVTSLGDDVNRECPILESLLGRRLSGLILAPISDNHAWLQRWAADTPLVFVDRGPVGLTADSFTEDDHDGALQATEHLIQHGHRRIAFIGDMIRIPTENQRLNGYRAALEAAGLPFVPELVEVDASDRVSTEAVVSKLWRLPQRPTAIFSANARCTMHLIPALRERQAAVVGYGDFPMADVLHPALTVIDQSPSALGALAARRVIDRLQHPTRRLRRHTVLPVTLIERASCAPLG